MDMDTMDIMDIEDNSQVKTDVVERDHIGLLKNAGDFHQCLEASLKTTESLLAKMTALSQDKPIKNTLIWITLKKRSLDKDLLTWDVKSYRFALENQPKNTESLWNKTMSWKINS